MDLPSLARSLHDEARRANERRLLVLAGERTAGRTAARDVVSALDVDPTAVSLVTDRERLGIDTDRKRFEADTDRGTAHPDWDVLPPSRAGELLGTTREAVVLDAHAGFSPNVLGRVVGAVDGGGLLVVVTPPLSAWPDRRTDFDETMAVLPFGIEDVTGRFRERLVGTLRTHPGVAIADVDAGSIEREGLTDPPPAPSRERSFSRPPRARFPDATYAACLTADQVRAVRTLESLRDPGNAVVVEADRGRGKSSAAGLAAGALAASGADVLVTAPSFRATRACFERAAELLGTLDESRRAESTDGSADRVPRDLSTAAGGRVRFCEVADAVDLPGDPDVVIVDEAAALPVRRLEQFLAAPAVAFCTTVHGYEGAGRGFDIRFRDRLAESGLRVRDVELSDPIRYAAGDPVESWAFRALLLDARPAVEPAVEDADLASVRYRAPTPTDLLADEHLLREAFGLLVAAHYRTEPDDLGRLLDAPNLRLRALTYEGHVVSVAMLAREGGLDADTRAGMYEGSRIRGNMLPDVLTSQLRDEDAAVPVGYRVVRIATHHALRQSGLGSKLLDTVAVEVGGSASGAVEKAQSVDSLDAESIEPDDRLEAVDWLGVGYGATPELLRFWARNGYRTVHFSTTRNDRSGEYSAIMLRPVTAAGRTLRDRHGRRFRDRVAGLLADPVRDADPDVVRALLRTIPAGPDLDLTDYEQRVAAGAAYGPGLSDVAPSVFRELALAAFLLEPPVATDRDRDSDSGSDSDSAGPLSEVGARERRLLVRKSLQAHRWDDVAEELGYVSTSECLRTFGETMQPLVDALCGQPARLERERYAE
jgi:tRNA(Met) cytidine acetyltransferase